MTKKTGLIHSNTDRITIGDFLARNISRHNKARADYLEEHGGPQIIIDNCRAAEKNPLATVKHIGLFQELVYSEAYQLLGRGGKAYIKFLVDNRPSVYYFPEAQYGPFMKEGEE